MLDKLEKLTYGGGLIKVGVCLTQDKKDFIAQIRYYLNEKTLVPITLTMEEVKDLIDVLLQTEFHVMVWKEKGDGAVNAFLESLKEQNTIN